MHELSIAHSILSIAEGPLPADRKAVITAVSLEIGELSSIEIDALRFAFDAIKPKTVVQNAELNIDLIPGEAECSGCATVFHMESLSGHNGAMAHWSFLTHHAHLLLRVAQNPDATLEELAAAAGITTRSAVTILNDLETEGYLERERRGRRNHYVLHRDRPLGIRRMQHTPWTSIEALQDLG